MSANLHARLWPHVMGVATYWACGRVVLLTLGLGVALWLRGCGR